VRPFSSQGLTIDVSGDSVTIGELVFDLLFRAFEDHAVDGLVREFIRKGATALGEKRTQPKAQPLVFFSGAVTVRTKPLEKTRKLFPGYFLLWL
jgi:hypothetical protein